MPEWFESCTTFRKGLVNISSFYDNFKLSYNIITKSIITDNRYCMNISIFPMFYPDFPIIIKTIIRNIKEWLSNAPTRQTFLLDAIPEVDDWTNNFSRKVVDTHSKANTFRDTLRI